MMRNRCMALMIFCASLGWMLTPAPSPAAENPAPAPRDISIESGDLALTYQVDHGATVRLFGVPMITGTSLWVMTPDWLTRHYGPIDPPDLIAKANVETTTGGGKRLTLHHQPPEGKPQVFKATEIFELAPGNVYSHSLQYEYTGGADAIMEWTVARLNATPLMGRPFQLESSAESKDGIVKGIMPIRATSQDVQESMLAKGLRKITIESRMGPLSIQTSAENDLWLFDYRLNRWADPAKPIFWMGRYERPIKSGETWALTVTMDFPDTRRGAEARTVAVNDAAIIQSPGALAPNHDPASVVPVPREQTFTGADMPLSEKTQLVIVAEKSPTLESAAQFFVEDIKARFDIEIKTKWINPGAGSDDTIPLGSIQASRMADVVIPDGDFPAPADQPEGYALRVTGQEALLRANTDTGLQYALMSLGQLVKVTEQGLSFKGVEIRDWPALEFRGIHCLSGKDTGDEIAKMIRTLMARHKMNALVWQCEYLIWDSAPELAHPEYGMSKQDAVQVIEAAREMNIELIPLVQSLGHSEWIFTNGQNLDIAEDPDEPYAYSPIVPRTYDFIFEIYAEALDFFKPKRFHIGHDEVTMLGEFPKRSLESGLSATELIMFDTLKLYRWFKERDIEVMLWGDMFIHSTEAPDAGLAPSLWDARVRRELLPRDVQVCDWHYGAFPPERFTSLGLFKDEGFPVIACSWYVPNNIRNLAVAAVRTGIDGFLQTTWAGFNFKIDDHEEAWFQYWAYLWAAHYAWNGQDVAIEDLPFDARQLFLDLWFERRPRREAREGFLVDLSGAFNRQLADDGKGGGWLGIGGDLDLRAFDSETSGLFGETRFHLGAGAKGERALMLNGLMNPDGDFPAEATIALGGHTASELHLLLTAAFATSDGSKTGELVINYKDGQSETIDLIYGRNIFAFDDPRGSQDTRLAWQGKAKNGNAVRLNDVTFVNPRPGEPLRSITLKSAGTEAAPILFAVTGVK